MDYIKGILSGLAAIFVAEFVFFWPTLSKEKATGLTVLQGSARRERFLAQILDCWHITVRAVLRRQSWQYCAKSFVFLDSDAHNFGARLFDCRDVRISLHNF